VDRIRNARRQVPGRIAAGFLLLTLALSANAIGVELEHSSINNGGIVSQGVGDRLSSTLGQPFSASVSGTTYLLGVGYWFLVESSGSGAVSDVPFELLGTQLHQNAPNPFNPSTEIKFVVGNAGHVTLKLYDVQGRIVATLIDKHLETGTQTLTFRPRGLASGVYLYRLQTADQAITRRLTLLK